MKWTFATTDEIAIKDLRPYNMGITLAEAEIDGQGTPPHLYGGSDLHLSVPTNP